MREIIFRGKRVKPVTLVSRWIFGNYVFKADNSLPGLSKHFIAVHDGFGVSQWIEVEPDTVGQYTGLKDKNGQRIFEGDIVDHYYQKGFFNRGVVMWDSQNARFAHELRSMSPAFFMHNPEAWEIIGNIHDNPEFMKEDSNA